MEALYLTRMTTSVNNIQELSDRPNTADGLTSQQLKERFDKAGSDIKDYVNTSLETELETYINTIIAGEFNNIETDLDTNYVQQSDPRLYGSRTCNNYFDNWPDARENLHITYGSSLPETGDDGDIFFLYS